MAATESRLKQLNKFLKASLHDPLTVSSARLATLFIEALCAKGNGVDIATVLIDSREGLKAIQNAITLDISFAFYQKSTSKLFDILKTDNPLASLNNGAVLAKVVRSILEAPCFYSSLRSLVCDDALADRDAIRGDFAWLLSQAAIHCSDILNGLCVQDVHDIKLVSSLRTSSDARHWLSQIDRAIEQQELSGLLSLCDGAGGRHDNDHKNITDISILPTSAELACVIPAHILTAADAAALVKKTSSTTTYLDNMFRLLREDMLSDLKEEMSKLNSGSGKQTRSFKLHGLRPVAIDCPWIGKRPHELYPWNLKFQYKTVLPGLNEYQSIKQRCLLLRNPTRPESRILPLHSLVAILYNLDVVGFGHISRDVDDLAQNQALIRVKIDPSSVRQVFQSLLRPGGLFSLIQVDAAVFAYEPFLKQLQRMKSVPMADVLVHWNTESEVVQVSTKSPVLDALELDKSADLGPILNIAKSIVLEDSQVASIRVGLTQQVALIQGPPGTGKSFIGAILVKALMQIGHKKILIATYTNHALDQFLEDLLDFGVYEDSIVRLGSKYTSRTENLLLRNKKRDSTWKALDWTEINDAKFAMQSSEGRLQENFHSLQKIVPFSTILSHLEFSDDTGLNFFDAFNVEESDDGFMISRGGKVLSNVDVFRRWLRGYSESGTSLEERYAEVWNVDPAERRKYYRKWREEIQKEVLGAFVEAGKRHDVAVNRIHKRRQQRDEICLRSHQIIACTTTAASTYVEILREVEPDVVLLEEAGEIQEPHVITTLGHATKRLIMIGDHKQLRPKINSYQLTVESDEGFDLNRSLLERLILNGYPHATLQKQHRMRPEISALVRKMTYPELEDADSTKTRVDIRGLQRNVVFIDHRHPETALGSVKDHGSGTSKQNQFEAELVLKIVKYLAQQGYGSGDVVVLTPYMGQLRLLRNTLARENDPVLNDMDYHDMKQAGLVDDISLPDSKNTVHLSSIDNYQGQECKIVVTSLTRSNNESNIGFMWQPERLNVLISRARDGIIMLGNSSTFENSRKGGQTWKRFFDLLRQSGNIFSGLPVKCEKHPTEKGLITEPKDFCRFAPDGGCSQKCSEMLACGVHKCPSSCHKLIDHTGIQCRERLEKTCPKGHKNKWICFEPKPNTCRACEEEAERLRRRTEEKNRQIAELAEMEARREELIRQGDHDRETVQRKIAILQQQRDFSQLQKRLKLKVQDLQDQLMFLPTENQQATVGSPTSSSSSSSSMPSQSSASSSSSKRDGVTERNEKDCAKRDEFQKTAGPIGRGTPAVQQSGSNTHDEQKSSSSTPVPHRSTAAEEWRRHKSLFGAQDPAIDELMGLVGLEKVKNHVLQLRDRVRLSQRQNVDMSKDRFNAAFIGNPGTGKTTVARLYGKILASIGIIGAANFEESTGSKLGTDGVKATEAIIQKLDQAGGGVFFIDEAYQLTQGSVPGGKGVLDFLLAEMENRVGSIVFIFAGYTKQMETFMGHNPGIPSRVPDRLIFENYTCEEFVHFLRLKFQHRFHGNVQIEGEPDGFFLDIIGERLGRRATKEGFANMRDLETVFQRICERQATRIGEERKKGTLPNDFEFKKADLIGPDPSVALSDSQAWVKLEKLIGLDQVKQQVRAFSTLVGSNYQRELQGKAPLSVSLNKVYLGPPGTGKTTVAKLYGQLLAEMGMLSNGEVMITTPADFIGAHIGESEMKTATILKAALGKVLVIDEAYMLSPTSGKEGQSIVDPFRTAVIDTIVATVHNIPGDDRCLLLLGYENQMEQLLQESNPGLSRRFPLSDAFRFESFNQAELGEVLDMKLHEQCVDMSAAARTVVMEQLERARRKPNFGNAGEVANLISQAISRSQKRLADSGGMVTIDILEPEDLDPDFKRSDLSVDNIQGLFSDCVGSEQLVSVFTRICNAFNNAKTRGMDPSKVVPFNFRFCGPPGTGKTTTARKIGSIYYSMGLLAENEVVEASASDFVAGYVGQTALKTRNQLTKALGKILLIDEAYRLADGRFGIEAVNELVDSLTKPKFHGNIIVILAGYPAEMERLFSTNPGLESRFPETITFGSFTSEQCVEMFGKKLCDGQMQCSDMTQHDSPQRDMVKQYFSCLAQTPNWGNARDVNNLAQCVIREALGNSLSSDCNGEVPFTLIAQILKDAIKKRGDAVAPTSTTRSVPVQDLEALADQSGPSTILNSGTRSLPKRPDQQNKGPHPHSDDEKQQNLEDSSLQQSSLAHCRRDDGVSDAIWNQLQADTRDAVLVEKHRNEQVDTAKSSEIKSQSESVEAEARVAALERACFEDEATSSSGEDTDSNSDNEVFERLRDLELARMALVKKMAAAEREKERVAKIKAKIDEERRQEAAAQVKLRKMGVCPAGYHWIRQDSGWRCEGGSHFVPSHALESL